MGYKGVSFPFRLNSKGGVLLSGTTIESPTHLAQAIEQLLATRKYERVMEVTHCCPLELSVFEVDRSAMTMIKSLIISTIDKLEPRVEVSEEDIDIEVNDNQVTAIVTFVSVDLGIKDTIPISIGGVSSIG